MSNAESTHGSAMNKIQYLTPMRADDNWRGLKSEKYDRKLHSEEENKQAVLGDRMGNTLVKLHLRYYLPASGHVLQKL
jgi:hypothetical protein